MNRDNQQDQHQQDQHQQDQHQQDHQQHRTTGFEDRLLAELRAVVAERGAAAAEAEIATATPAWRRGPRLALAGTAVLAAAAAALIVSAGGSDTPTAYAVEPQGDGEVSVEIRSLEDAEGLEAALREEGIPAAVDYVGTGMACKEPRFARVTAPAPTAGEGGSLGAKVTSGARVADGATVFSVSRNVVGPGQTLVLTASPGPDGEGEAVQMQVAEGEVAPCEPVPADAAGAPPAFAPPAAAPQGKDAGPSTTEAPPGAPEHGLSTKRAG